VQGRTAAFRAVRVPKVGTALSYLPSVRSHPFGMYLLEAKERDVVIPKRHWVRFLYFMDMTFARNHDDMLRWYVTRWLRPWELTLKLHCNAGQAMQPSSTAEMFSQCVHRCI
jgi:hypothetical protein